MLLLLGGLLGLSMFSDDRESSQDSDPGPQTPPGTGGNSPPIIGSEADETLGGGQGNDVIRGEEGDDLIQGYEGNDLLFGGVGDDTFFWHAGEDTIFGGAGDDVIFDAKVPFYTGPNVSVIDGGSGDDTIGFEGGSTVTGGEGADVLTMFHDATDDDHSVITDFDPTQDSLSIMLESVTAANGNTLRVQDWDDGQGADLYYGNELLAKIGGAQGLDPSTIPLRVALDADGGDISFADGDGDTTVFGNTGNDTIFGQGGDDLIIVGDTPSFGGSPAQGGENLAYGGAGGDTLAGSGGTFDVYQTGGPGDGRPISISYEQEISRDTLFGGEGDDFLLSENGNDLTGGVGSDVFAVSHLTGENATGFTLDPTVITDFNPVDDEIVLTNGSLPPGEILSIAVWANGLGSDILAGDTVLAQITGGQSLTVADIRMENNLIEAYLNA